MSEALVAIGLTEGLYMRLILSETEIRNWKFYSYKFLVMIKSRQNVTI